MPDLKELFSFPIASERKRGTTPSTAHPRRQGKKKKDAPRLVQQSLTFRETLRALCHLYKKEHDPRRKEEIVEKALALLRRTAGHLRFRLPAHIDVRELEGWGVPGLLQAIESYDHHSPASFETHAQARIRGSILDTIRDLDTVTRVSRNKARKIDHVVQQLQQQLLRQPESTETAAALGLSLDGYYQMLRDSQVGTQVINFSYPDQEQNTFYDNLLETTADPETSAETQLATADRNQALQRTVAEVPNAEIRTVLTLHYFEGQSLKEIAASLKKSESRISQLHQDGLKTLRNLMKARGLTAEDLTISPEIPRQYVAHRL